MQKKKKKINVEVGVATLYMDEYLLASNCSWRQPIHLQIMSIIRIFLSSFLAFFHSHFTLRWSSRCFVSNYQHFKDNFLFSIYQEIEYFIFCLKSKWRGKLQCAREQILLPLPCLKKSRNFQQSITTWDFV